MRELETRFVTVPVLESVRELEARFEVVAVPVGRGTIETDSIGSGNMDDMIARCVIDFF